MPAGTSDRTRDSSNALSRKPSRRFWRQDRGVSRNYVISSGCVVLYVDYPLTPPPLDQSYDL